MNLLSNTGPLLGFGLLAFHLACSAQQLPSPQCPAYSTFELVPDTSSFADMCFLAEFMRLPQADEQNSIQRDIDLDNSREILEQRPAYDSLYYYYVFEDSLVGPLYKGYFIAPQTYRVRRLRQDQVVIEYTSPETTRGNARIRLEYRDSSWINLSAGSE